MNHNTIQHLKNKDDEIQIDISTVLENNYNSLIIKLKEYGLKPNRMTLFYEGICVSFTKNNTVLYVELYNDGDMGYIIEDIVNKKSIDNKDLTSISEVIHSIKEYIGEL